MSHAENGKRGPHAPLITSAAMAGTGAVLVLAGLAVGGGDLLRATRHWIREMEAPPSELAKLKWSQVLNWSQAGAAVRPASLIVLVATRVLTVQAADLENLDPEGLEPGEQPVQRRLVPNRAVQDSLDRFHRGGEPVEVEQRLGRKDT
jgi:hypothetical protein